MSDDIEHAAIGKGEHPASLATSCPDCVRITKLCRAFREFGYTDLTMAECRDAYHIAMTREATAADGIIAMLTRSQLRDADLVNKGNDEAATELAELILECLGWTGVMTRAAPPDKLREAYGRHIETQT